MNVGETEEGCAQNCKRKRNRKRCVASRSNQLISNQFFYFHFPRGSSNRLVKAASFAMSVALVHG